MRTPWDTTAASTRGSSELRLTIAALGGERRDVAVEVDEASTIDQLTDALALHTGLAAADDAPLGLKLERLGTTLSGSQTVASSGMRSGDILAARRRGRRDETRFPGAELETIVELVVASGPAAGDRRRLSAGSYVVGRDPSCEIVIDDPSLSRRHLEVAVATAGVSVRDAGSSNGTAVGSDSLHPTEVRLITGDEEIEIGRTIITFADLRGAVGSTRPDWTGDLAFNRPPRVARPHKPLELVIPAPPGEPLRPSIPVIASLLPLVFGVVMWQVLGQIYMLLFTLLTPVMALGNYASDRGSGRRRYKRALVAFRASLATVGPELDDARRKEAAALRRALPDPAVIVTRAQGREPELWERRPDDGDFMALRLGLADQPARTTVKLEEGGIQALRDEACAVIDHRATLESVPAAVDLPDAGTLGLCGSAPHVAMLGRWLVTQVAVLHSPSEVSVAAAIDSQRLADWEWLKWLPHTSPDASPIEGGQLMAGRQGARELLRALGAVLVTRRDEAKGAFGPAAQRARPFILLVMDEAVAVERSLMADILADGPALGIGIIWLGRDRHDLPGQCGAIAELDADRAKLELTFPRTGQTMSDVSVDGINLETTAQVARSLAPVRDSSAAEGGAALPRTLSLLEALELPQISARLLAARWAQDSAGLSGVIGAQAGGPLNIDLRADGPHALIAGTTGAGKSELLQTLVAALAASHPPARLSFLLIDYKGGAAFRECVELPHTVGMITDLDEFLTRRALTSLNAELRHRERLLNQAAAKNLMDMERRQPDQAPASLIIVVDEFATLVKEVPEFVEGIVDVAQRGRSLGVHLVLATQRPGGVVSENIRANTNLRIALRVASTTESDDVISAPDAGRISRAIPGRGYARTGHGELTAFQAAYAGATSPTGATTGQIRVRDFEFDHRADPPVTTTDDQAGQPAEEVPTDLMRLISACRDAVASDGLRVPSAPWLPQLPDVLGLEDLLAGTTHGGEGTATIGLVDEPARQLQSSLTLDLQREGSAVIYGTTGAGKTALLRTIAVSLALNHTTRELHLYGLDFAGRGLAALEALPQCGSVIAGDDRERIQRLLRSLSETIQQRNDDFAKCGASTLTEYRRIAPGAGAAEPRIVVLLDSYGGFGAIYDRAETGDLVDTVVRLIAEGRAAGVHFLITGDRRSAIPPNVNSSISRKLVLRLGEEDEYGALGLEMRIVRGARLPAGRGFTDQNLQFQTALLGTDPTGDGQARALARLAERIVAANPGAPAEPIRTLPTTIHATELPTAAPNLQAIIGIRDSDLQPALVDLTDGHFLIAGPYHSGRTTALGTLAAGLKAATPTLELHLLSPRRTRLSELSIWDTVSRGSDACGKQVEALHERLHATTDVTASNDQSGAAIVIFLDDAGELADAPCGGTLDLLLREGRDGNLRIVAAFEAQAARGFSPWVRELRKDGHGLLLDPDANIDGDLLGVRLPRRIGSDLPPGRGYLVGSGNAQLMHVAS